MGDDADICTECDHRREDHRDDYGEPYCRTCLNDVVMDGTWEDDERREGIFHLFGLPEAYDSADSADDDCWLPECEVCGERRARREFLSEMFEAVDTGFRSFAMVRDLLFDEENPHMRGLTRHLVSHIRELREAIEAELNGTP